MMTATREGGLSFTLLDSHFSVRARVQRSFGVRRISPLRSRRGSRAASANVNLEPEHEPGSENTEASTSGVSPATRPAFCSTLGVTNQMRAPARRDVRLSTSMRQTPPFLNGSARPAPIEMRGQLAEVRARGRRARCGGACAALASCARTDAGLCPGASASSILTDGFPLHAGREQIGRLLRAHERAREDFVDLDVERLETVDRFLEARDAPLGQRPLVVVGPVLAALGGDGVANEIERAWGRHASGRRRGGVGPSRDQPRRGRRSPAACGATPCNGRAAGGIRFRGAARGDRGRPTAGGSCRSGEPCTARVRAIRISRSCMRPSRSCASFSELDRGTSPASRSTPAPAPCAYRSFFTAMRTSCSRSGR